MNHRKIFSKSIKIEPSYGFIFILLSIAALLLPFFINLKLNLFDIIWSIFWLVVALIATIQAIGWLLKPKINKHRENKSKSNKKVPII